MSRCYPEGLQSMRMSSSEDYQPFSATETQEMGHSAASPSSHGMDGNLSNKLAILRKRKKRHTEVVTSDTTSLISKRPRETILSSSSPTRGVGTTFTSDKGGSRSPEDNTTTGERRVETRISSLLSSGLPHFLPPNQSCEGKNASLERSDLSEAHNATTSAYGCSTGLGNQSTVTTSSIGEEEESTSLHNVIVPTRETDTVNIFSVVRTGERTYSTHNDDRLREHQTVAHRQRQRGKSRLRDSSRDGEVLSPFSGFLTSAARDGVFELQDEASCGDRSGKTETTCVLNSGCSSIEAGRRESPTRRATDYGSSILKREDSGELVHSSCSQEPFHGRSIGADLCLISDSMLSGMVNAYKLYSPMEPSRLKEAPSRLKESVGALSERNSAVDETLADRGRFASDELRGDGRSSEATPESSQTLSEAGSQSASEEQLRNCSGPMEVKSSGEGCHPCVDGSLEQITAPTFVLSSGRMSQEEASKLGRRPRTVDVDFDEYFAQLML